MGIADRQAHIRNKFAELCAAQGRGVLMVEGEPRWELFDLASDPGEKADISAQHPELVVKMKAQYEAWFDDVWTLGQSPTKGDFCVRTKGDWDFRRLDSAGVPWVWF